MRIKKKPALGSGLFEFEEQQPSPFALGSGLFGQSLPQGASAAAPWVSGYDLQDAGSAATPTAPGWVSAEGGQGYGNGMAMDVAAPPMPSADESPFGSKFEALLNNPMFQLGINLLGASNSPNPWGTALNNTLATVATTARGKRDQRKLDMEAAEAEERKRQFGLEHERALKHIGVAERNASLGERNADLDEQRLSAQKPLWEAQIARAGADADLDRLKLVLDHNKSQRMQQMQDAMMQELGGGLFGGGQQTVTPPAPGTDSLFGSGSSGQSGTAPLTKLPSGMDWGAINRAYAAGQPARDDDRLRVLQEELALTDDPALRAALQRDITRMGAGTAPMQPGVPMTGGPDRGMRMARAGAMGAIAGVPGASQLVEVGKMMQPQNVSPGSYRMNPADGSMTFIPDPYREQSLAHEQARVNQGERQTATTEQTAQRANEKAKVERQSEVAQIDSAYNATLDSLKRMRENADALLKHPGTETLGGWSSALGLHKIPGTQGADAAARFDSLKSKMVVETLGNLKRMSETGASGFGQLSEAENKRLETYVEALTTAQSDKALKDALRRIVDFADTSMERHQQHYKTLRGAKGAGPAPAPAAPGTAPDAPIDLRDLLQQRRSASGMTRTDTPISHREAVGRIR